MRSAREVEEHVDPAERAHRQLNELPAVGGSVRRHGCIETISPPAA
jgi:hypothetical protein